MVPHHILKTMISDIFSSFDPAIFNSSLPSPLFIILNILLIISLQIPFWSPNYRLNILSTTFTYTIISQLNRTFSFHLKGLNELICPLFTTIILINLIGLIPYSFRTSSHLLFTLSLGLPLWIRIILSRLTKYPKIFIAHFLPDGAPDWLNPFLVLIETTRITVRPLTLSFRLAANMRAGHIVLRLLGIYASASLFRSIYTPILLISTSLGYILFEVAICIIQAYIFCLLLSLYSDDHAH